MNYNLACTEWRRDIDREAMARKERAERIALQVAEFVRKVTELREALCSPSL